jgi:hypothetical protein
MRLDLPEDPAVMAMAEALAIPEECVVGYLHKIWSWASRQCSAGSATNVTLVSLERVTRCPQVPQAMAKVGWLVEREIDGVPVLDFPNWDHWLSESAKKRMISTRRQQRLRSENCSADSATEARPALDHAHGPRTRTREDVDHKGGGKKTQKKPKRTPVTVAAIADRASGIFHACRYRGTDGGNLWGVAALMEAGIGDLSENEVASACQGAALNGRDKAAHFFGCLSETLEKRGENLTELLRRVTIVPAWPKTKLCEEAT